MADPTPAERWLERWPPWAEVVAAKEQIARIREEELGPKAVWLGRGSGRRHEFLAALRGQGAARPADPSATPGAGDARRPEGHEVRGGAEPWAEASGCGGRAARGQTGRDVRATNKITRRELCACAAAGG